MMVIVDVVAYNFSISSEAAVMGMSVLVSLLVVYGGNRIVRWLS